MSGKNVALGCLVVGLGGVAVLMVIGFLIDPPGSQRQRPAARVESREKARKPPQASISPVTFAEIDKLFGYDGSLTEIQKRELWPKYDGKCVEWTGTLEHADRKIMGGFTLGFRHRPDTLTYDVLLDARREDRDEVMAMRQGAIYKYRATLRRYGGPVMPISGDYGCR